jgi:hypothetical protein
MRRNTEITSITIVGVDTAEVTTRFPGHTFKVCCADLDSPHNFKLAMARECRARPAGPVFESAYRTRGQELAVWNRVLDKAFGDMDEVSAQRWTNAMREECKRLGVA